MAMGQSSAVLRDIGTLFNAGTTGGLTDAQLLDRFMARGDRESSESAFAGLIARHGPMVLGVCRRALNDPNDVADAFQATFLILVRKADTVRVNDSLGRWLYGVSRRVAVRAKRTSARRSAREVRGHDLVAAPAAVTDLDELRQILDEEIDRLPEKFRAAVVLCGLEGLGHEEAARQLGCAAGTVKSRLSRAREKLRSRLIRRGIAPTALALYVESTSAAVPAILIQTTATAAVGHAELVISPAVTFLIQGAIRAMFWKKLSTVAITIIACLALASGAGVLARQSVAPPPRHKADGQQAPQKAVVENQSVNTAVSSAIHIATEAEQVDQLNDRIENVLLDLQLLSAEVSARKTQIDATNGRLVQLLLPGASPTAGVQAGIESMKEDLALARKEYLSKKKEYSLKQRELVDLRTQSNENGRRHLQGDHGQPDVQVKGRTGADRREASNQQSAPGQHVTTEETGISPILNARLKTIDQKLDQVLKELQDLKRAGR